MRKIKGFNYESSKLNGWELGRPPTKDETWVITDDKRRCIANNGVLVKWSLIGTKTLMWHSRPVTDEDYLRYDPPNMPEEIEIVYED